MDALLSTGLQLLVVGMGVVFAFLVLLVIIIKQVTKLIERYAPEPAPIAPAIKHPVSVNHDSEVTAAIGAAIHQHRKNHLKQ
ncbi:MAG: OadG family protein [Gammaproteobacteria bacterium]|nr:OadG family protein [Gammaproteobacteria bacterium]